jgi:hypothetical protein
VLNSSLRLNIISLRLRNKPENTLYFSLLESRALSSKAFPCSIGGRALDNILNYRPSKAYDLPNLAIALSLLVKGANSRTNRSSVSNE